LTLSNLFV